MCFKNGLVKKLSPNRNISLGLEKFPTRGKSLKVKDTIQVTCGFESGPHL